MRELENPFDAWEILRNKKNFRRMLIENGQVRVEKRIAILSGSTIGNLSQIMELFLLNYGIKPIFYESKYDQYYQDAMLPCQELEAFSPDVIYIHTTWRNIRSFPSITSDEEKIKQMLHEEADRYYAMWDRLSSVYGCTIIQNNFDYPDWRLLGNRDATDVHGRVNYITRMNEYFYIYARGHEGFYINDINYLSARIGLDVWSDPMHWFMYSATPSPMAIPELCFSIANIIKSIYGYNKKAIVCDLDNTLWGGVIAEDGVEQVAMGQETGKGRVFDAFQTYIKAQTDLGILLCVDSKNDLDTALQGLKRPDCVLCPEDFVSIRANWEPKDQNLLDMAKELNILPASMVFVDDNPAERAILNANVPDCAVPELNRPEEYVRLMDRCGFFEVTQFSNEDMQRTELYVENAQRMNASNAYLNYTEFLASLEMRAEIRPFESLYINRIAQLTNKSNQFNLTTKKCTEAEVRMMAESNHYITLYGRLSDRFGDNGVVAITSGRIVGEVLHIELWLMSCRVLKRGMEYAMMDALIQRCRKQGIREIRGYYFPTAKNSMVKNFYADLGFKEINEDADGNISWKLYVNNYQPISHTIKTEE